jgi:hypothetical protein
MLKRIIVLVGILSAFLLPQASVFAACDIVANNQCIADQRAVGADGTACRTSHPDCYSAPTTTSSSGGATAGSTVSLVNPLGTTDPQVIIGNLIKAILSIIGSVTLLMFIYGGVLWVTSMGNDKMIAKGKAILVWTTVGLAVIAGAYVLTQAVITGLTTGSVIGA